MNAVFTVERVVEDRDLFLQVLQQPGLMLSQRAQLLGMSDDDRFVPFYGWLDQWGEEPTQRLLQVLVDTVGDGTGVVFGWEEGTTVRLHVGEVLTGSPYRPIVVEGPHPPDE